jgi:hypothetical protein
MISHCNKKEDQDEQIAYHFKCRTGSGTAAAAAGNGKTDYIERLP